jgi:hypothetical protein
VKSPTKEEVMIKIGKDINPGEIVRSVKLKKYKP